MLAGGYAVCDDCHHIGLALDMYGVKRGADTDYTLLCQQCYHCWIGARARVHNYKLPGPMCASCGTVIPLDAAADAYVSARLVVGKPGMERLATYANRHLCLGCRARIGAYSLG